VPLFNLLDDVVQSHVDALEIYDSKSSNVTDYFPSSSVFTFSVPLS